MMRVPRAKNYNAAEI